MLQLTDGANDAFGSAENILKDGIKDQRSPAFIAVQAIINALNGVALEIAALREKMPK